MLDTLTSVVEAGAAAPWVLLVVLLVAVFDALVPPLPSEGLVVALAAISVSARGGPDLVLLAVAAGVGAFVGDTLTFVVGRLHGPGAWSGSRGPASAAFERAAGALERRGALVILSARYVPMGRVAVNLTAGATGFPPRRFGGLAALAAGSWAAWSVGVGAPRAGGWRAARSWVRSPESAWRSCSAWPSTASPVGSAAGGAARAAPRRTGRRGVPARGRHS